MCGENTYMDTTANKMHLGAHIQQQQPSLFPLSGVGYMDQMTP